MLTHLRVSKYKFTGLLKTTESTKITPAGDELSLDIEKFKDSHHEIIKGTISSTELVICSYCNTMATTDSTIKSGNISFTVTGVGSKFYLHVTPETFLEQFKTPISKKFKLAKSMLKSNALEVCCVTGNQVTK